ncbi:YHYH protein [Thioclava sp. A2]|uniref:YHYH protein n=1 Tax=Thioclava sp. FCG-A2 TaxID=3080562 RepID=UPI002954005F|nr:YHYH protein [Thioclava sp. A2]MDV7270544.1 YHYH protein [Thioclava sp. A2]
MLNTKILTASTALLALGAACSSMPEAKAEPASIDITNAIFDTRSTDCADYAAVYHADAEDAQDGRHLHAALNVTNSSTACTFTSNSVPNHSFNTQGAHFVKPVTEVISSFTLPRFPAIAARPTALSQRSYDAIMLNGIVLDMLSAGCYRPLGNRVDANGNVAIGCTVENDDWLLDPLGPGAGFGPDSHNAHTQPDGRYHYHGNPMAMFGDTPSKAGSPVIGFAADGFPIYGSYFVDDLGKLRKARSGYALRPGDRPSGNGNPGGTYDGMYVDDYVFANTGDLDACNGMTVNGQYGYYVTETYPWVLKCFSGTPDKSFQKGPPR